MSEWVGRTDHVKKLTLYLKSNGKTLNCFVHVSGILKFTFSIDNQQRKVECGAVVEMQGPELDRLCIYSGNN